MIEIRLELTINSKMMRRGSREWSKRGRNKSRSNNKLNKGSNKRKVDKKKEREIIAINNIDSITIRKRVVTSNSIRKREITNKGKLIIKIETNKGIKVNLKEMRNNQINSPQLLEVGISRGAVEEITTEVVTTIEAVITIEVGITIVEAAEVAIITNTEEEEAEVTITAVVEETIIVVVAEVEVEPTEMIIKEKIMIEIITTLQATLLKDRTSIITMILLRDKRSLNTKDSSSISSSRIPKIRMMITEKRKESLVEEEAEVVTEVVTMEEEKEEEEVEVYIINIIMILIVIESNIKTF